MKKDQELTPLQKKLQGRKPVPVVTTEIKEPVEPNSFRPDAKPVVKKDGE